MVIQLDTLSKNITFFKNLNLINEKEANELVNLFDDKFPFIDSSKNADSVHVHIKVDDTKDLPHEKIVSNGGNPENSKEGYIKYSFAGGVNFIFSSINVSQEDLINEMPKRQKPFVDHFGLDLRQETAENRKIFENIPNISASKGWKISHQGGNGNPVYCCHVEVSEKYWAYPSDNNDIAPIEFAYGPLTINQDKSGCDLRPANPGLSYKADNLCCGVEKMEENKNQSGGYYYSKDLARFAEVGNYKKELMDKFFDYYTAVTGTDGALTKREKALIALAVAHNRQCPYCIDAYTNQCLDNGSNPEEMTEAIHVATAMDAGITLVHGVQMHNAMQKREK